MQLVDAIREELRKRKGRRARGGALERALADKLRVSAFEVREALGQLVQEGAVSGQWHPQIGFTGMVDIHLSPLEEGPQKAWTEAMRNAGMADDDIKSLKPCAAVLEGLTPSEMTRLASGLLALRERQAQHNGERRYRVSARYLLGSSKALDHLPSSALCTFGIDMERFPKAPAYIMVAGPKSPHQVILVENPQAFEEGVKARLEDTAWIATQGYGLARNGDAFGRQLVRLVEDDDLVPLVRAGSPPSLEQLLSHDRLFFWGDLDPAGLDIFMRLKKQLPKLQLSGIYRIMLKRLQNHCGHPLVLLTGKDGQTACSASGLPQELVQSCSALGLDQEIITSSEIASHADKVW